MRWHSKKTGLAMLLLVFVLPGLLWVQLLLPKRVLVNRLQQDIAHLRAASGETPPRALSQVQLADLTERLETVSELTGRVGLVHQLLKVNGISLLNASYKLVPGSAGGIGRYEIQLETDGPYYGLRLFLRALLAEDTAIALAAVDLRRPVGGGGNVRAVLKLVMYVNEEAL